jgi:hypothetical protein
VNKSIVHALRIEARDRRDERIWLLGSGEKLVNARQRKAEARYLAGAPRLRGAPRDAVKAIFRVAA